MDPRPSGNESVLSPREISGTKSSMVTCRRALAPLAAAAVVLVTGTACTSGSTGSGADVAEAGVPTTRTGDPAGEPCLVAAAGDVAGKEDDRTGAARTAELISSAHPEKVLALGDLAYQDGTAAEFSDYYDPTWGALKSITAPAPGNHEYRSDGKGYFDYFDVDPNYAFDVCGWHVVSVDQYAGMKDAAAFIKAEGEAAGDRPMVVFWHEPRFSSGSEHGSNPDIQPLWDAAVSAGADIVLNGHDHDYERFEPRDAAGDRSPDGTVEFVSGNGGHDLRGLGKRRPHSAAFVSGAPGVLFLVLRAHGYDWRYEDVDGHTGDAGSRTLS
jgi:hypothetical protein